ncbi:hypothetical protein [Dyadobacter sp. 50-39]|uniref:hypothetical protein n=1 Tax=Dyadobacter sp. 50-39 TaxID=1895756 RepID=UPI000A7CBA6A|nr:hypothetical protein [Dyadobacter sp. 50-39]
MEHIRHKLKNQAAASVISTGDQFGSASISKDPIKTSSIPSTAKVLKTLYAL